MAVLHSSQWNSRFNSVFNQQFIISEHGSRQFQDKKYQNWSFYFNLMFLFHKITLIAQVSIKIFHTI